MYIPGGNRLIFSRKINLIGPNREQDIEAALRGRFPDLDQDNFHTGLVHLSYYLTEPVADPGWNIRLVIPVVEDDITPVVLFKAALSTYEGLGPIYVPPNLNKHLNHGNWAGHCVGLRANCVSATAMAFSWALLNRRSGI